MSCTECGEPSKYKCPTCRLPYCSVQCCVGHKKKPCSPPAPEHQENVQEDLKNKYEYPTADTVQQDKLKLLDDSIEIRKCLENPHVREMMDRLDNSPHPEALLQEFMTDPIFTEFVDACLKIVQPEENNDKT